MRSLQLFDSGTGDPVILVPGIQGRWEWMRPCAEGLAAEGRVITASLPGEPGSGFALAKDAGFDVHADYLDAIFERAGIESAVLCGVSFGGWVSVHYAATRPERVKALVLASAPGPAFKPDPRQAVFARAPRLLARGLRDLGASSHAARGAGGAAGSARTPGVPAGAVRGDGPRTRSRPR